MIHIFMVFFLLSLVTASGVHSSQVPKSDRPVEWSVSSDRSMGFALKQTEIRNNIWECVGAIECGILVQGDDR